MKIDLSQEFISNIYQDHEGGGVYPSDDYFISITCPQCGDSDRFLGSTNTLADLREIFEDEGYGQDYFEEFVKNYCCSEDD